MPSPQLTDKASSQPTVNQSAPASSWNSAIPTFQPSFVPTLSYAPSNATNWIPSSVPTIAPTTIKPQGPTNDPISGTTIAIIAVATGVVLGAAYLLNCTTTGRKLRDTCCSYLSWGTIETFDDIEKGNGLERRVEEGLFGKEVDDQVASAFFNNPSFDYSAQKIPGMFSYVDTNSGNNAAPQYIDTHSFSNIYEKPAQNSPSIKSSGKASNRPAEIPPVVFTRFKSASVLPYPNDTSNTVQKPQEVEIDISEKLPPTNPSKTSQTLSLTTQTKTFKTKPQNPFERVVTQSDTKPESKDTVPQPDVAEPKFSKIVSTELHTPSIEK